MQQQRRDNRIEQLLAHLTDGHKGTPPQDEPPQPPNEDEPVETIHVYFVRESEEPHEAVAESTIATPQRPAPVLTAAMLLLCLLLPLASILVQLVLAFHPPIATVTIMPTTKTVTISAALPLGRLVPPLTVSQSATTKTTGTGHQDAAKATGTITFYNGLFTRQRIAAGTLITGADGVHLITDQQADVPAGNPPSYGQATVPAHAIRPGERGNIAAYDINQACCASAVLAKNTIPFTGGLDERTFHIVATRDIATTAASLKQSLAHSLQGALQGQLRPHEHLALLPCAPTIASDQQTGQEATSVTVTVSAHCSAVAYNSEEVERKATVLLTTQAAATLGAAYSLFGAVHVNSIQATTTQTPTPLVFLSFKAFGTWLYGLSRGAQQQIKQLIAGKTKQQALHLLAALPGVAHAAISWGDGTNLPKDSKNIHLMLFIV
jgi:Baseplate J-like protein